MKLMLDAKLIADAIAKIRSVLADGGATDYRFYWYTSSKKHIRIAGDGQIACAFVELGLSSETEFKFSFDDTDLLGLIKGRGQMEFELVNNQLSMKAVKGAYKCATPTRAASEAQMSALSFVRSDAMVISREALTQIYAGIVASGVTDVFSKSAVQSYISVENNRLSVSSLDSFHFGNYSSAVDCMDFKTTIPASYFKTIIKMMDIENDSDVRFSFSNSGITVFSQAFSLRLPSIQSSTEQFALVETLLMNIGKPAFAGRVPLEDLKKVCTNLGSIYEVNSSYQVKLAETHMSFELKSAKGSASDDVVCKAQGKPCSFSVDPRLLHDLLSTIKHCTALRFALYKGRALLFKYKIGDAEVTVGTQLL